MRPEFITFTGVDANTDLKRLASISGCYPVEWGVLFSRNRQGLDNRYPALDVIETILTEKQHSGIRLAAHLCGKHAQEIMEEKFDRSSLPLAAFDRIQVNHVSPEPRYLRRFAIAGQPVIAQWRDGDSFPSEDEGFQWLYDPSGGRGIEAKRWPTNNGDQLVGYAGGINPETVETVNAAVSKQSKRYWLDMESGVRTDDWFDLDLVERVCAAVYG